VGEALGVTASDAAEDGPVVATLDWMISIALTWGFSTSAEKPMSTTPSLVTANSRIVAVWSPPAPATMSKWSSTRVPSRLTSNTRLPTWPVGTYRLAK
jgi:hypothetical protein